MIAVRAALAVALLAACAVVPVSAATVTYVVEGDGIARALDNAVGDASRGRALVANRQASMCLLCHQAPIVETPFQGDISTNLAGAGARWSEAQLRLRLVNARLQNPNSVMPAYYRSSELTRVAAPWRDKTLLNAQEIEDVIAWLRTLQ